MMRLLSIVFSFLLLLCCSIILVFNTSWGTHFLIRTASRVMPGELSIGQVDGVFAHGITLQNIHYQSKTIDIQARELAWQWQPAFLWQKKIIINDLIIDHLKIIQNDAGAKATSIADQSSEPILSYLSYLPYLHIQKILLNNFSWQRGRFLLNANAGGGLNKHWLSIKFFAPQTSVDVYITGAVIANNWHAKLEKLTLINDKSGNWSLITPATITMTTAQVSLENLNWHSKLGNLLIDAVWNSKHFELKERGRIKLLPLGIVLSPFSIDINGDAEQINYRGVLTSGHGSLTITGKSIYQRQWHSHFAIDGQDFLAANTESYKVWVSPNLILQQEKDQPTLWQLTGSLLVPKTNIAPPDFSQQTVQLPSDVSFVNNSAENNDNTQKVSANIQLQLGKEVYIAVSGLTSRLEGKLALHASSDSNLATANGVLTILQGKYKAYGQGLTISRGQLIFNGNAIDNPGLQITVVKKIHVLNALNNATSSSSLLPSVGQTSSALFSSVMSQSSVLTVGINVSGTLNEPMFSLFSNPPLASQTDTLAYFLFGHPANQLSLADAKVLLQAATSSRFESNQTEQLIRDLQSYFSLDKLSIESTSYVNPQTSTLQQNASLVLGKALSPKLYVGYSVGLLSPVNVFTLRYMLSKRWSLQSTGSTFASGLDLFYTLDRD